MVDEIPELPKKPSFVSSVASGITGFIKGTLAGGFMGGFGGALVGAAVAAIGFIGAPIAGMGIAVGAAALIGAAIGAAALGTVGAAAGTVTGIVRSREVGQPTAEDVVNVAKISFAQGVAVGHNIEHASQAQAKTHHQDKITTERAAMAMAEHHVIN